MTISVKLKSKKARKLLEDLASQNIIEIATEQTSKKLLEKERTFTHLASESSLSKTWVNPTEDEAWKNL